jgi:hypothetical protein
MKAYLNPEKAKRLLKKADLLYVKIIRIQNRMIDRMGPVMKPEAWNSDPEAPRRFRLIVKELRLIRKAKILKGELEPMRFPRGVRREGIVRFPRRKKIESKKFERQLKLFEED